MGLSDSRPVRRLIAAFGPRPATGRASHVAQIEPSARAVAITPAAGRVLFGCLPRPATAFARSLRLGAATSLSRPARHSLALRPAGSLGRPRRPLSRGFGPPVSRPSRSSATRPNRQLPGWNPPPLVIRAFGAHSQPWLCWLAIMAMRQGASWAAITIAPKSICFIPSDVDRLVTEPVRTDRSSGGRADRFRNRPLLRPTARDAMGRMCR